MLKIFAVSTALALVAGAASAAPLGFSSVVVRTGGLDLDNPADVRRLDRRLDAAAMEVCGAPRGSVRMLRTVVARSDCFRETRAQAAQLVAVGPAAR